MNPYGGWPSPHFPVGVPEKPLQGLVGVKGLSIRRHLIDTDGGMLKYVLEVPTITTEKGIGMLTVRRGIQWFVGTSVLLARNLSFTHAIHLLVFPVSLTVDLVGLIAKYHDQTEKTIDITHISKYLRPCPCRPTMDLA
jgi:hypothetical protein